MNTTELESYLTGLILGDGYLDKGVTKRAFSIRITAEDWAKEIYSILDKYTPFSLSYVEIPVENRKKIFQIRTKAHPYFAKRYHYFYDDYRKRRILSKALDNLTWIGWANWFMSDGYVVRVGLNTEIYNRRLQLCLDRYSEEDRMKVSKKLLDMGIETSITKKGRLNFYLRTSCKFLENIYPYVVPSLQYKLNLWYDYKPDWMTDTYYKIMQNIQSARQS